MYFSGKSSSLLALVFLGICLGGVSAGYDPNLDYEELMESFEAYPKAHTYAGRGKLGEMTLYEIQDFADQVTDPDARERVEQFSSSMEMMLKMMNKDPATTRLNDLRELAHNTRQGKDSRAAADGYSDENLEQQLLKMMGGGGDMSPDKMNDALKPLYKALGLNPDDLNDEKLQELMAPENLHEMSQQMLKTLGLGGDGAGGLGALFGMGGEEEWTYESWLQGLSEKDQKNLNNYLQGEIPASLDELKEISKSELTRYMSPLSANRIWRHIHLAKKNTRKKPALSGPLAGFTKELSEVMDAIEKNPRMKEYSERFVNTLLSGDASSHEDILELTKEMQKDPQMVQLADKMKSKGPMKELEGLQGMLGGVNDQQFKTMMQQMAGMGLPGFDDEMMERMKEVDMDTLKSEYGQMMEALLQGKDLSSLELPTIDHIMGRGFHDDL